MRHSSTTARSETPRLPWLPAVAVLLLLCAAPPGGAEEPAGPEDQAAQGPEPGVPPAKEPVCIHGCERWGNFCNVDPRGVYKCRRRCEKFGEICE